MARDIEIGYDYSDFDPEDEAYGDEYTPSPHGGPVNTSGYSAHPLRGGSEEGDSTAEAPSRPTQEAPEGERTFHVFVVPGLEEKCGLRIEGLAGEAGVVLTDTGIRVRVIVRGDIVPRIGDVLPHDVELILSAYDDQDRVIGRASCTFAHRRFLILQTFELQVRLQSVPKSLRLYPVHV